MEMFMKRMEKRKFYPDMKTYFNMARAFQIWKRQDKLQELKLELKQKKIKLNSSLIQILEIEDLP